jgi:hypothetical protein
MAMAIVFWRGRIYSQPSANRHKAIQDRSICFHAAALLKDTAGMNSLLEDGQDVDASGLVHGDPALCVAAAQMHSDGVHLLLRYGANVHAYSNSIDPRTRIGRLQDSQAIHYSAASAFKCTSAEDSAQVCLVLNMLVGAGADVNARSRSTQLAGYKATPLMLAARTGDVEVVDMLLRLGADPHLEAKHDDCEDSCPCDIRYPQGDVSVSLTALDFVQKKLDNCDVSMGGMEPVRHARFSAVVALLEKVMGF